MHIQYMNTEPCAYVYMYSYIYTYMYAYMYAKVDVRNFNSANVYLNTCIHADICRYAYDISLSVYTCGLAFDGPGTPIEK